MTKSEYREEHGKYDACVCQSCGGYFPTSALDYCVEPHGEKTPLCPECGCDDIAYGVEIEEEEDAED